jgi:hypothetical protein
MEFKTSQYILISDPLSGQADDLTSKRMIFSTRKGMGVTVSNYLLQLLESRQFELIPDAMFNILLFHEIIIAADEDELTEIVMGKRMIVKSDEITVGVGFREKSFSEKLDKATSLFDKMRSDLKLIKLEVNVESFLQINPIVNALNEAAGSNIAANVEIQASVICLFSADIYDSDLKTGRIKLTEFHLLVTDLQRSQAVCEWASAFVARPENSGVKLHIDIIFKGNDIADHHAHLLMINALQGIEVKFCYAGNDEGLNASDEKNILRSLSSIALPYDLIPPVSRTFYSPIPASKFVGDDYQMDKTMASINMVGDEKGYFMKRYYDDEIVSELLRRDTACSNCVYMPLCGGRLNKSQEHALDCPGFISNFIEKARLKYKIPLEIS